MNPKPTPDPNQNEVRTLLIRNIDTRSAGESGAKIDGFAAVYDEYTEIMDWWGDSFQERIQRGALTDTLGDGHDIFALKNHNWNEVLGRTGANLVLTDRENGLFFDLTPNQSTLGRDIVEDVRSGLIKGCSIGFRILEQLWEERDDTWFRTITKIELREITLTPIPAYTSTTAEVRSLTPPAGCGRSQAPSPSAELQERQAILEEANKIIETYKRR